MGDCSIRFAVYEDIPKIMKFIDHYWAKGHILAANRELFEWQYTNDKHVNMVIGIDDKNDIQGILGFIPYNSDGGDLALALWKANHLQNFLGIRLMLYLRKEVLHRSIFCIGINPETTSKIYEQMGMKVGTMRQWYRLSPEEEYKIAYVTNKRIPDVELSEYTLTMIKDSSELKPILNLFGMDDKRNNPHKSESYIIKRYFSHPIYQYQVYGVKENSGKINALIILRPQEYQGAKVIRFVDCIGNINVLKTITSELDRLMIENQAEYMDMYEAGIRPGLLQEAGWLSVKESGNIIPNYFAPFKKKVIDIHYCTSDENAIFFRGDGDQDRPN